QGREIEHHQIATAPGLERLQDLLGAGSLVAGDLEAFQREERPTQKSRQAGGGERNRQADEDPTFPGWRLPAPDRQPSAAQERGVVIHVLPWPGTLPQNARRRRRPGSTAGRPASTAPPDHR